jgi:hypothetical protein
MACRWIEKWVLGGEKWQQDTDEMIPGSANWQQRLEISKRRLPSAEAKSEVIAEISAAAKNQKILRMGP